MAQDRLEKLLPEYCDLSQVLWQVPANETACKPVWAKYTRAQGNIHSKIRKTCAGEHTLPAMTVVNPGTQDQHLVYKHGHLHSAVWRSACTHRCVTCQQPCEHLLSSNAAKHDATARCEGIQTVTESTLCIYIHAGLGTVCHHEALLDSVHHEIDNCPGAPPGIKILCDHALDRAWPVCVAYLMIR